MRFLSIPPFPGKEKMPLKDSAAFRRHFGRIIEADEKKKPRTGQIKHLGTAFSISLPSDARRG